MRTTGRVGIRLLSLVCSASFLALAGAGLGCSNDNGGSPNTNSFYGTYTDPSGVPGTITLTGVASATAVGLLGTGASTPLTGSLNLFGQLPIDLGGFYFTETGALSFSSDDDAYTFNAQVTGASAPGTSTGPNGPGAFVLFTGGSAATVAIFCGSAVCTSPAGCEASAGVDLAVSGSTAALTGFANDTVVPAVGTRMGDIVSLHIVGKGADITVSAVINGSLVGGTWSDSVNGVSGTWNGSTGNCSEAPVN